MKSKNFRSFLTGKGYYIALILCAAAIGITGYLYYRNANQSTDAPASVDANQGQDVLSSSGKAAEATTAPPSTTPPSTVQPTPLKRTRPVAGDTVMDYAMQTLSYNPTTRDWRVHCGIDIAAQPDTPVCAAADGTVYTVYADDTMGTTVVIRHSGGYVTKYASLSDEVTVKAGDKVTGGQAIGCVGCSALLETSIGEHVHFSVTCNGENVDPEAFLSGE